MDDDDQLPADPHEDAGDDFHRGGAEHLWQAMGRAPTETAPREILSDLYGSGPKGGLNTKAAAADLGVSERTVRRWAHEGIPAHTTGDQVRSQHTDWQASPEGREAKMNPRREQRIRSKGTTVSFAGKIKISRDIRRRAVSVALTGEQMGPILDALLAGNDAAAQDALEDAFGDVFGGSLSLAIESLSTKG